MQIMKKLGLLSICLFWTVCVMAQPKMKFNKEINDFGIVLWANPATAVFEVTNTGNTPLVINDVQTSCACTVADWPRTPIAPGASAAVTAVFDAKALGTFYKEVMIASNATTEPVYLQMRGKVVANNDEIAVDESFEYAMGDVRMNKDALSFDAVNRGSDPVEEILVMNTSRASFEPVLMHLPDYLEVTCIPQRIPAGRTGKLQVKLLTDKLNDMGLTQTSVYLSRYFGDKVGEENEIPVSVVLLPDFSNLTASQKARAPHAQLSTTQLKISLAKKAKGNGTITIKNVGLSTLKIDRLQVFSPAIGVSLPKKEIAAGATVKMKITVQKDKLKKNRRPRILMITNDPDQPEQIITIQTE